MSHNRTADGQLQPDPSRFPSGMKALADFVSLLLIVLLRLLKIQIWWDCCFLVVFFS